MALSTSMPTAKARPARLMTFKLRPKSDMPKKVPMALIGIARPMIRVLLKLRKKTSRTATANPPPTTRFDFTREMALSM